MFDLRLMEPKKSGVPSCPTDIWRCNWRRLGSGFRTGFGGGSPSVFFSLSSVLYTLPGLLGSFIATCKAQLGMHDVKNPTHGWVLTISSSFPSKCGKQLKTSYLSETFLTLKM